MKKRNFEYQDKFFSALEEVFVGAPIQGQGGFINLLKIRKAHYDKIKEEIIKDLRKEIKYTPNEEDDVYEKLYDFFSRYFSPNGSVYFTGAGFTKNVYAEVYKEVPSDQKSGDKSSKMFKDRKYEKVYTAKDDVMLFWKTNNLYYVKTDNLFRNMLISLESFQYHFDVTKLTSKGANQKQELYFSLINVDDEEERLNFEVSYKKGNGNNYETEIYKYLKEKGVKFPPKLEELQQAFKIFKRQVQCDFFINKNAKKFLREQFMLWYFQYLWHGSEDWDAERIKQLQDLKRIAFNIIDFFSQFEDELVRIWNKPKFVRNSNYVLSLDKFRQPDLVKRLKQHPGYAEQKKEWAKLDIKETCPTAPIDTKYFKEMEIEILGQFENLEEELDGWLIHSENYQALNTILPKFKEKIQCVYIDPPFNLGKNGNFDYMVDYKDASWTSLLENRVSLAKELLNESGCIFVRCDYNGNWIVRPLLDSIFGIQNHRNDIDIKRNQALPKTGDVNLTEETENLIVYSSGEKFIFKRQLVKRDKPEWVPLGTRPSDKKENPVRTIEGQDFIPPENRRWSYSQENLDDMYKNGRLKVEDDKIIILLDKRRIGTNWTDITGYSPSPEWGFTTENSEKLLRRVLDMSSEKKEYVLDFFLGSGTTTAVAHKMGRKWIGVEMGEQFNDVVMPRMKQVLAYDKTGISKDIKDYKGGGFFKYYDLEQYEETLNKCRTESSTDLIVHADKSLYEQYVFLASQKLLDCLKVNLKKKEVKVDLNKLYKDIDFAETLANLMGKEIKSISKEQVTFTDDTSIKLVNPDPQLIKPLIWWDDGDEETA